jgi:hypothetical protein
MPTQQERETALANSVAELRARIAKRRQDGWQPEPGETPQEQRTHWRNIAQRLAERARDGNATGDDQLPQLRDDRAMNIMAREFLQAAERGNPQMTGAYIEEGFPVNWQSPKTGETALHVSASAGARNALRVLVGCGQCNYLLRDKRGRLASELAYLYGRDSAVTRWLRIHERRQAKAQGIKLTRRPPPP